MTYRTPTTDEFAMVVQEATEFLGKAAECAFQGISPTTSVEVRAELALDSLVFVLHLLNRWTLSRLGFAGRELAMGGVFARFHERGEREFVQQVREDFNALDRELAGFNDLLPGEGQNLKGTACWEFAKRLCDRIQPDSLACIPLLAIGSADAALLVYRCCDDLSTTATPDIPSKTSVVTCAPVTAGPVTDMLDYSEEIRALTDVQLKAMAREPESGFPQALWQALNAEILRRSLAPQVREVLDREQRPADLLVDVAGWTAVSMIAKSGASPDDVYDIIASVIASDSLYNAFTQPGYRLDLQVSFPADPLQANGRLLKGSELMWVRTIGIDSEPNHWVGRILNDPQLFHEARKDEYVVFRADNRGLWYVRAFKGDELK